MNHVKFFRRRQFILGSDFLNYEGWHCQTLFENFKLTLHPDLPITYIENQNGKAILLGYIIDPFQSELGDEDILKQFAQEGITIKSG